MIRPRLPIPLLLASLLLAPATLAAVDPMAGAVRTGQTHVHTYDGTRGGLILCPMVGVVGYAVYLTWAPTSDALTLTVPGRGSATDDDGSAMVWFTGGPCARFEVRVTGTSVDTLAAYQIRVTETQGA